MPCGKRTFINMILSEIIETNPSYAIILPMMFGLFIAAVIVIVNKRMFGRLTSALIESGAESEETAVKPEDCGVKIGKITGKALKNVNSGLRKVVSVTEDGRLYIVPEKQSRAETVYNPKDASIAGIILIFVGIVALTLLLLKLVPWLTEIVENAIGNSENV